MTSSNKPFSCVPPERRVRCDVGVEAGRSVARTTEGAVRAICINLLKGCPRVTALSDLAIVQDLVATVLEGLERLKDGTLGVFVVCPLVPEKVSLSRDLTSVRTEVRILLRGGVWTVSARSGEGAGVGRVCREYFERLLPRYVEKFVQQRLVRTPFARQSEAWVGEVLEEGLQEFPRVFPVDPFHRRYEELERSRGPAAALSQVREEMASEAAVKLDL